MESTTPGRGPLLNQTKKRTRIAGKRARAGEVEVRERWWGKVWT